MIRFIATESGLNEAWLNEVEQELSTFPSLTYDSFFSPSEESTFPSLTYDSFFSQKREQHSIAELKLKNEAALHEIRQFINKVTVRQTQLVSQMEAMQISNGGFQNHGGSVYNFLMQHDHCCTKDEEDYCTRKKTSVLAEMKLGLWILIFSVIISIIYAIFHLKRRVTEDDIELGLRRTPPPKSTPCKFILPLMLPCKLIPPHLANERFVLLTSSRCWKIGWVNK